MLLSPFLRRACLTLAVTAGLSVIGTGAAAQTSSKGERYTAFAVNMAPMTATFTTPVDITIDRWSTDAERDRMFSALAEAGPEKLLETVQKLPTVGRIRTPDSLGYDLHYARRTLTGDGAERVVIVTDRPIGFWEAANRPRVSDYPFTVIELHVPPSSKGEGKISVATKITFDKDTKTIMLENYAAQPVMLSEVRREKK